MTLALHLGTNTQTVLRAATTRAARTPCTMPPSPIPSPQGGGEAPSPLVGSGHAPDGWGGGALHPTGLRPGTGGQP
ncbi:hypothetical protein J2X53_002450 [Pseudorhodobacter sp. 4114]|nr:hypothetical protein [Pseudorhodobacter sp. 4114]